MTNKALPLIVTAVDFDTVLPFWHDRLWPGRVSPIKPVSTMMLLGGYDLSIRDNYTDQARFFGAFDNDGDLIGVFSGHPTSEEEYRGRGLYVVPEFTGLGVGQNLVQAVVNAAMDAGRELVWCIPRVMNVPFFQKADFVVMSEPFSDGVEFGPNIYMGRAIVPF